MTRFRLVPAATVFVAGVALISPSAAHAQAGATTTKSTTAKTQTAAARPAASGNTLGTVKLAKGVVANGEALSPGTYTLRLVDDAVTPVVGQSTEGEHWVEFVQSGQVKGKELASVVAPPDVKTVAKGKPPAAGTVRVEELKGGDYLRVWFNHAGTSYLIHLSLHATS
jgi:hypothetical protein